MYAEAETRIAGAHRPYHQALAMLIAEDEEGHHEPVAVASTINEAKEIAESDLRSRMRRIERGEDPGICPYTYKVWARGIDGDYRIAYEITDLLK